MEGTDQVLAARMVHTGLAADRRIDHGQQGGGHLHHGDSPEPGGGRKASHVADDPTAQGHQQGATLQFALEGGLVNESNGGGGFLLFTGLHHQQRGVEAGCLQAGQGRGPIEGLHLRITHHQQLGAGAKTLLGHQGSKLGQAASPNHDRIGLALQGDLNRLKHHRLRLERGGACLDRADWSGGAAAHGGHGQGRLGC